MSQETLRLDIYSQKSLDQIFEFTGTVSSRLNVISDPKQIQNFSKSAVHSSSAVLPNKLLSRSGQNSEKTPEVVPKFESSDNAALYPKPTLSLNSGSYAVGAFDSAPEITSKFVHLLALGPISRKDLLLIFSPDRIVPDSDVDSLISANTQSYSAANTFTEADTYPSIALQSTVTSNDQPLLILKDKAYKDLRPWLWTAYTPFERGLIIENAQNALTRLGYLETHPLRRKIVDKTQVAATKKLTGLGGGLILSHGKKGSTPSSPQPSSLSFRRGSSESPNIEFDRKRPESRSGVSPLKETQSKRKYESTLTVCLSSSDEDRLAKKAKNDGHRSNSNTSTNSSSSTNSNSSLASALSHHSNTSYSLPFSVNDEGHDENNFGESAKFSGAIKPIISLPPRPSSAISTQEKKLQFYLLLAKKFRLRYREYEKLHKKMRNSTSQGKGTDNKKSLMKLFELHNSLAEWKRKLWDFHNENNMAESVMNLSKHRKLMSTSAISVLAPPSSRFANTDKFPQDGNAERLHSSRSPPVQVSRTKTVLNY